ncbi:MULTISPECIES: TetR/AcrR family transcriptional regulator [Streptomyces]|uniref:TetR/AcrR family transcriptional regulator n=1 Tax=Streptomyces TaxID=1883 RepID=UPI001E5A1059|nr:MULTISPECIES: TetR/AcrR family transcriptional regulator [Streptomyces]UFQ17188.1 TetR/AcrR family transcriptional regulator [Streptomyces huasconensis]WCL86788.1 TetR/AcrR family transcriptional regulator [Streptomyces sp. JCM 35825]
MSPKQRRGVETAERLLDAALQVYADAGEQGVTVGALTRASGVSLGSLYHHFGSVDGLMNALLLRWLERLLGELAAGVARSRTARGGVRALVQTYLTFVQEHPDASRLLHSSYADRVGMAHAKQLRDAQEARLSPLTEWVRRHVESGEIAPLDVPVVEALVMGPIVATARRRLSGLDDVDLGQAARVLPDRIWRSLTP